jgi:hypothetical protein
MVGPTNKKNIDVVRDHDDDTQPFHRSHRDGGVRDMLVPDSRMCVV